jgi:hypothetical protein
MPMKNVALDMSITVLTEEQKELKSPPESIKGIKANITMDEILEAIKHD